MSLLNQTLFATLWNFSEQLLRRGVGIFVTLILAYFLTPEDYGLVAMMAVFITVGASLMHSGFREALIRLPNVTQEDYNSAFAANIILGLFAYIILFCIAPLIAEFYERQELVILIRVASLTIVISSFQIVQLAALSRALNFKIQMRAALPASVISGIIAIFLAAIGWGVWALVTQMLSQAFLHTILLWVFQAWRPTNSFSIPSLKSMYSFGYKLFLSGLLDTVFKNLYVIVIAKLFSATTAGLYYFAHNIRDLVITQLVSSIQTVTYPALSRVQEDPVKLKDGYRKVIRVTTFIMFPAMLFLAGLADILFRIFLPDKWEGAVIYLQLMCISGTLYPLHAINLNILKVKGRSDLFLGLEILKKLMAVIILLVSFSYGVVAILIGQIISSVISLIPNCYFTKSLIGYSIGEQIKDFLPGLLLAILVSSLGFSSSELSEIFGDWGSLLALTLLMSSMYVILSLVFQPATISDLKNIIYRARNA